MSTVPPATRRQQRLYKDLVNVYPPSTLQVGVNKRLTVVGAGTVDAVASYANQPCKYFPSSEYNAANVPMGRTLQDNMLTLDRFHFPSGVELVDGTVIELVTVGHPDAGTFYMTQGNSETWVGSGPRKSRYARVFAKRIPPPSALVESPQ